MPIASSLRRTAADSSAQRMLREIAQALEVLAAQKPIVLWLEDLHWSDPSSLAVIAFLAGRRDPARLLLIASFRPADAQAGAPTAARPGAASSRSAARRCSWHWRRSIQVPWASTCAPASARDAPPALEALGAFLHRRSDGNALFTVAMVDDLVRRRRLVAARGQLGPARQPVRPR